MAGGPGRRAVHGDGLSVNQAGDGPIGRARADRVAAGEVEASGLVLHDGNIAGVGDLVVTRRNQRTLPVRGGRDFVKNGDLWRVTTRHDTGELTVALCGHGGMVTLPREYAAAHVELGYASTVHRAQGMTVDSCHVLVDPTMTRQALYVAMSRGRDDNHAYVVTDEALEVDLHTPPRPPSDLLTVLGSVLSRDGSERSATETLHDELAASESLATLVPRYVDALPRAVHRLGVEPAVRAGLRDAGGPDLEQRVADSPGWRRLLITCLGDDPRATVAEAVRSRLLDTVQDVPDLGALLTWRIEELTEATQLPSQQSPPRIPWLPTPSAGLAADPVGGWVIEQDRLVHTRVAALVDQVAATPPRWAHGIPARPEQGPARARWEADVALVAAYSDQHRIPDDLDLLAAAGPGPRRGSHAVALAAQRRLKTAPNAPAASRSVNQRLHALAEAARQDPDRPPLQLAQRHAHRRHDQPRPTPRHGSGPTW